MLHTIIKSHIFFYLKGISGNPVPQFHLIKARSGRAAQAISGWVLDWSSSPRFETPQPLWLSILLSNHLNSKINKQTDFSYICIEVRISSFPFPLNLSFKRARFFSIIFTSTHQHWLIRDLWVSSSIGWKVPAYSPHLRPFSRFPAVCPYLCCSMEHDRALDVASSSSTCWQCSA